MNYAQTQDLGRRSRSALSFGRCLALSIGIASLTLSSAVQAAVTVESNMVSIKVDELLDVTVAASDPGDVTVAPGSTGQILTYQLTNSGNGSEAFTLAADTAKPGSQFAGQGDAGAFADGAIALALGNVPGDQTRTITFQVTID